MKQKKILSLLNVHQSLEGWNIDKPIWRLEVFKENKYKS